MRLLDLNSELQWFLEGEEPRVWAVHVISPSTYDEERFKRLLRGMKQLNVGVIVCPTAAISMRQLRPVKTPTWNSITRVLDLIEAEIPVAIGTDNIADVFVPEGDGDPRTEAKVLAHAIRFHDVPVMAKLLCGKRLNESERERVARALHYDKEAWRRRDPGWSY